MSDLLRLFSKNPTPLVTPLEDFATEALAIAINHDPQPFVRMLEGVAVANWRPRSGKPGLDRSMVSEARAETQQYLSQKGLDGGRLDLVVTLGATAGSAETIWVEVKIEARPTLHAKSALPKDQFGVYLDHLDHHTPRPILLALTKYPLSRQDVTRVAWDDLVKAVRAVPRVDRSWTDLVDFLREKEVWLPPLPPRPEDYLALLPVFRAVNTKVRDLWPDATPTLYWPRGFERAVRLTFHKLVNPLLTSGPLRYGLVSADGAWRWRIAVATGSDYYRVRVAVDAVVDAAHHGGLAATWVRTADPNAVLLQERPFEPGGSATDVSEWLTGALAQIHQAGVIEPYLEAMRTKAQLRAQQRAAKAPKAGAAPVESTPDAP